MNEKLVGLALLIAPEVIARLRSLFARQHPDEPQPSDEEIIAAYESAFASSVAKDDAWFTAHPE